MTEILRTALVGCGKVGDTHAQALATLPQSEFVAAFDVDQGRADAFAQKYGAKGYANLEEMIDDAGVQTISICTPHPTHADVIVRAAAKGVHTLVEKPLASDLADADRAIDAARAAGVKLGVVSQRRLYPPVARMAQAIADGKIGLPILGTLVVMGWRDEAYYQSDPWRGSWDAEGGGVLVNQTPHQLDMLQWLMGSDIDELYGYWDNFNHPYVEIEDTAVAVLRFKNGSDGPDPGQQLAEAGPVRQDACARLQRRFGRRADGRRVALHLRRDHGGGAAGQRYLERARRGGDAGGVAGGRPRRASRYTTR